MRPTLPLTPRARGCYDAPAPVSTAVDDPRVRALALLKRHGYNATSFQTLERGFRYWFDGDEACVAYADTGSAWVVAGAPIAPCSAPRGGFFFFRVDAFAGLLRAALVPRVTS